MHISVKVLNKKFFLYKSKSDISQARYECNNSICAFQVAMYVSSAAWSVACMELEKILAVMEC